MEIYVDWLNGPMGWLVVALLFIGVVIKHKRDQKIIDDTTWEDKINQEYMARVARGEIETEELRERIYQYHGAGPYAPIRQEDFEDWCSRIDDMSLDQLLAFNFQGAHPAACWRVYWRIKERRGEV